MAEQLLLTYYPTLLTLTVAILLYPLVRMFPRLTSRSPVIGRTSTTIGFLVVTAVTAFLITQLIGSNLFGFFLHFKFISISKLPLPSWLVFSLGLLVLDFTIYWNHRIFHAVPALWPYHSIHHADEHVTSMSAFFHHPLETVLTYLLFTFVAVVTGIPVIVVFAHAAIAAAHNAFAHANIRLPNKLEQILRWVIVTPDVHRTHHSVDMREGNSNFGSILSVWDRLFGTYLAHPNVPEPDLLTGLPDNIKPATFSTKALLALPFRRN
jgi:sterol desaturase/sphingolipid hydroxylase (fatty acid hydroxylase superfamily)